MIKLITKLSCLGTLLVAAAVQAQPSNVIIFGDSLSDIDNVPQSTVSKTTLGTAALNVYVPFSNPVVTTQAQYTVPGQQVLLNYPDVSANLYLSSQPTLDHANRQYRSINWTQFFLSDLQQISGMPVNQSIIPWVSLYGAAVPLSSAHLSVNYAFGGAMSVDSCFNGAYTNEQPTCDAASIYAHQQAYRNANNLGLMPDLQTPSLLRQIMLFKNDVDAKHVTTGPDTLYVIWIGGNDINNAFNKIQNWQNPIGVYQALTQLGGGIAKNVKNAIQQLTAPRKDGQAGAKHIIVINMFDVGLTPYVHNSSILAFAGGVITNIYNNQLANVVKAQNNINGVSIQLFDAHAVINKLAENGGVFAATLGQTCQSQPGYYAAAGNPANCDGTKQQLGYLFWDAAHPSMPAHAAIGYGMAQYVLAHWQTNNVAIQEIPVMTQAQFIAAYPVK